MIESTHVTDFAELPNLSTFARAAERGSFTAAATDLGITQAAVSQRIAGLERELRAVLFERRGGRVFLTPAGQRLHEFARRILELQQEARRALGGLRLTVAGDLPIAASSVPSECFLSSLLFAFHAKHSEVRVRTTVGDSSSVMEDVEKGRASLGLVGQMAERPGLVFRPLGGDSLVLVVPPGYPWVSRGRITISELADEPIILRESGSAVRGVRY